MRQTFTTSLVTLATVAALSTGCGRSHPLVGQDAPDLTLTRLNGDTFHLAEHEGEHILLLDFWATWCSPCRVSMPVVADVAKEYEDKDVRFFTLNMGDSVEAIQEFLDSTGLDVPVVLDPRFQAALAYSVDVIPQTVLIDKSGRVQAVHIGGAFNPEKRLRRELDALVAGESLVQPSR